MANRVKLILYQLSDGCSPETCLRADHWSALTLRAAVTDHRFAEHAEAERGHGLNADFVCIGFYPVWRLIRSRPAAGCDPIQKVRPAVGRTPDFWTGLRI